VLLEIAQANEHEVLGHFEGQGPGLAKGLCMAEIITEAKCEALRQVFKGAADRQVSAQKSRSSGTVDVDSVVAKLEELTSLLQARVEAHGGQIAQKLRSSLCTFWVMQMQSNTASQKACMKA